MFPAARRENTACERRQADEQILGRIALGLGRRAGEIGLCTTCLEKIPYLRTNWGVNNFFLVGGRYQPS